MRRIIDTFLDFARSSPTDIKLEPVDATIVLRDAVDIVRQDLDRHGGMITLPERPVPVRGDAGLLTRLFQNLLDNALKFAKPDVPPQITITAEHATGFCTLSIEDNGIGIQPGNMESVFELFARGKPTRGDSSSGIGLALCRRIAVLHGGSIKVDPDFERGTRFLLTLQSANLGDVRDTADGGDA